MECIDREVDVGIINTCKHVKSLCKLIIYVIEETVPYNTKLIIISLAFQDALNSIEDMSNSSTRRCESQAPRATQYIGDYKHHLY